MSGSAGLSKSKNESQNQSGFDQNVWNPSGQALQQMYGQIAPMFDQTARSAGAQNQFGQGYGKGVMNEQFPAFQQQLGGGAYQGMGLQDNLMDSINRSERNGSATQRINNMVMGGQGNNYADAMKNQYVQDANLAQQNMLGNLDARASASGMSGGARQGVATARGMQDINRNLQQNMAQTGFSAFDKDLDRKLGIAQQADQGTMQRQQLMASMLGGQQNAMQGGLRFGGNLVNQAQGQQMMPWQQAGAYSNILGSPTVLGSGQSAGNSSGKGFGTYGSGGM